MMHLDGRALQWHQHYSKLHGGLSALHWTGYIAEMRKQFVDTEFADPMSDLVSLRHTTTVDEYYEDFLHLLNALQLPMDYSLSIFVINLKPDISRTIRLFSPKSLTHALNLAKQLESLDLTNTRRPFIPYKNPPSAFLNNFNSPTQFKTTSLPPLLPTPNTPPLSFPSLSSKYPQSNKPTLPNQPQNTLKSGKIPTKQEMTKRKRKGLYMWCGVKYIDDHQCLRSQLYHMLVESEIDNDADIEEFSDCVDSMDELVGGQAPETDRPILSLHALSGTTGY